MIKTTLAAAALGLGLSALAVPVAPAASAGGRGMTTAQLEALEVGQTRHQVQTTIDDRGCRLAEGLYAGRIYLRKLYKVDAGALWVAITYVKSTADTPFRLVYASPTNDLQLLGESCGLPG